MGIHSFIYDGYIYFPSYSMIQAQKKEMINRIYLLAGAIVPKASVKMVKIEGDGISKDFPCVYVNGGLGVTEFPSQVDKDHIENLLMTSDFLRILLIDLALGVTNRNFGKIGVLSQLHRLVPSCDVNGFDEQIFSDLAASSSFVRNISSGVKYKKNIGMSMEAIRMQLMPTLLDPEMYIYASACGFADEYQSFVSRMMLSPGYISGIFKNEPVHLSPNYSRVFRSV